jgi:hypothetical protein
MDDYQAVLTQCRLAADHVALLSAAAHATLGFADGIYANDFR